MSGKNQELILLLYIIAYYLFLKPASTKLAGRRY